MSNGSISAGVAEGVFLGISEGVIAGVFCGSGEVVEHADRKRIKKITKNTFRILSPERFRTTDQDQLI